MSKNFLLIGKGWIAAALLLVLGVLACAMPVQFSSDPGVQDPAAVSAAEELAIQEDEGVSAAVENASAEDGGAAVVGDAYLAYGNSLAELYDEAVKGVVGIRIASATGGGQGSGFVVDSEGHIVTNYHVVEGATVIEVGFWNGFKTTAEAVGTDLDSDLAVLKVDVPAEQLFPLALGDSDKIRVGEVVVAIGNPFGLGSTMTAGIVSAKGRVLSSLNITEDGRPFSAGDLIQTDAAINPGNSGGPLLNIEGEVIGINRAIQTESFSEAGSPLSSGIGFSVSVNILKRVVQSLIETGSYDYPLLGISSSSEITIFDQQRNNLPQATGALVGGLTEGGPADTAGVEIGDLITHIDGREIIVFGDLLTYLLTQKSPGETVDLTIYRQGETVVITVTLGKR